MTNKKVNFDDCAKNYNQSLSDQLRFFDKDDGYFAEYKIQKVTKTITHSPKNILDFGCGTGRSAAYLQQYFPESNIYGYDISVESLIEAKKNYPGVTFLSSLTMDKPVVFDLIFLAGVFHHIVPADRPSIMNSLFKMTATHGMVVVFEHNPFNPLTRHLVNTCPFDHDAVLLKPRELKSLFLQAGLSRVKSEYTLFFPAAFKFLRGLESYLKHFPMGGQFMVSGTREP
jgi:SAM-dependent methyltransferase